MTYQRLNKSNGTLHLGQLYAVRADESHSVHPNTVTMLIKFYQHILSVNQGITIVPTELEYSFDSIKDMFSKGILPVYTGGSDGTLGIDKILERATHDIIHISIGADFTNQGEFQSALATMRLFDNFVDYQRNCSDQTRYQVKQVIYSDVYLQACYYNYFGTFPDTQKIVLVQLPSYW